MTAAAAMSYRRTAWLLAAAAVLLAVFAMHGLGGGHQLFIPSPASPAGMAEADHEQHGSTLAARAVGEPSQAPAGCPMPGHVECLARLQSSGGTLPLHAPLTTSSAACECRATERAATTGAAAGRAPPGRHLTALCICRT